MQSFAKPPVPGLARTDMGAAEIQNIRFNLGLEAAEMAEILRSRLPGVTQQQYLKFEAGRSVPSRDTQAFLIELESSPELVARLKTEVLKKIPEV